MSKASRIAIFLLYFYRNYISCIKLRQTCRFYPCCSEYAIQAFKRKSFFTGLYLTLKRLLKCNGFFKGGYDPVK